jgi:hypothetical protein
MAENENTEEKTHYHVISTCRHCAASHTMGLCEDRAEGVKYMEGLPELMYSLPEAAEKSITFKKVEDDLILMNMTKHRILVFLGECTGDFTVCHFTFMLERTAKMIQLQMHDAMNHSPEGEEPNLKELEDRTNDLLKGFNFPTDFTN